MPREAPHRLSLTEFRESPTAIIDAAAGAGLAAEDVRALLSATNERLMDVLRLPGPALSIRGDGLKIGDVAGLIRVSPRLELEVAPKFLGAEWPQWRGDFFVVATLSRYGTLLPADRLRAGFRERGDLATLVGRAIVDLYWQNHRRPLRTYQRSVWRDFWIDGDVEAEELFFRNPDGFEQSRILLARTNTYNQVMHAAVAELLPEIRDVATRRQLLRVRDVLSPQSRQLPRSRPRTVPSRHRRWQTLFDLSEQVLGGFGIDLAETMHRMAPGYVLKMAKAWEDLITSALRVGLPGAAVRGQLGWLLGTRNGSDFKTTPDVTLRLAGTIVLADAKYKGRAENVPTQVATPDVYEALAFLRAAKAKRIALLYPRSHRTEEEKEPPGATKLFETIVVDDLEILAYEVECRGLSDRDGFRHFVANLAPTVVAMAH